MTELEQVLHSEIPLTQAIGIKVSRYSDGTLTLTAPIEKNTNHKSTAFGGSLYSVAVLSGWGLLYLLMRERCLQGHIVIQESQTRFIRPVSGDIEAVCSFESNRQVEQFIKMFERKGRARIKLISTILQDGEEAVVFSGSYVVHR